MLILKGMEVITVPVTVRNVADFEPEAAKNNWISIQQHLLEDFQAQNQLSKLKITNVRYLSSRVVQKHQIAIQG